MEFFKVPVFVLRREYLDFGGLLLGGGNKDRFMKSFKLACVVLENFEELQSFAHSKNQTQWIIDHHAQDMINTMNEDIEEEEDKVKEMSELSLYFHGTDAFNQCRTLERLGSLESKIDLLLAKIDFVPGGEEYEEAMERLKKEAERQKGEEIAGGWSD